MRIGSARRSDSAAAHPARQPAARAAPVEDAKRAERFPLRLVRCRACGHLQLADRIDRDLLFRDYKYATGAAPGLVQHFGSLARMLVGRHQLAPGSAVVEVGSND